MNFSDQWRSLWPVSSVFAAPNLLSGASSKLTGPLLFHPSPSPLPLLSSPSLALQVPPPLPSSSLVDGVHTFFGCPANEAFLPSAAQDSLSADILSSLGGGDHPGDPIPANNLHALLCRNSSTLALFFPTGENAHSVGYLGLSFKGGTPEVRVDRDGDFFKQREGFKYSYQRILKMSVVPTSAFSPLVVDAELSGNFIIEGMLIATTLYSVNWFRIETRVSDSGQERPFLVPMAKQGFESSVVHACWSPHFPEESATLLDNGDLCWFNLNTKRGGKVRVTLGGDDPGAWLSCEFGGQPWILMVACSKAIVLVDLRSNIDYEPKFLARIDMLNLYPISSQVEKKDQFLAFCKASFNDFHTAVVSESQLLLFDTRQPLVPVLTWDHGFDYPTYVAMFRLSELRPSTEFKWASESGFAILVGSFWDDQFNLFCYGPRERGALNNSYVLYAWELPSCLSLSGRQCGSADHLLKELFLKDKFLDSIGWQHKKDVLAGFCIVPDNLSTLEPESGGFALIRVTLYGKLEMQSFHASWDSSSDKSSGKVEGLVEQKDSIISCMNQGGRVSTRYDCIKLRYLYEYINGNLSNALVMPVYQSYHKGNNQNSCGRDLAELSNNMKSSSPSVSSFISDASIPTSIFEIALRKVLSGLCLHLLPLAFSKYSDLFVGNGDFSFEFLEVPSRLPQHSLPPFFTGKPSRRSEKWSKKAGPGEALVGPVLPPPVLLTLQQMFTGENNSYLSKDEPEDDSLNLQCKTVLDNVFPEISIADTGNEWEASQGMHEEKPFFVYEPTQMSNRSTCNRNDCSPAYAMKEELPQMDPMEQTSSIPESYTEDKKFTTFICGIAEKTCGPDFGHESVGLEMLDLSPVRLDFDSPAMVFQPREQKIYKCLKKQFSKWQGDYKPYQDFCTSLIIPKQP